MVTRLLSGAQYREHHCATLDRNFHPKLPTK